LTEIPEEPSYQLLAIAAGVLDAAQIIVDKEGNKALYRAPIAHLIAHGLEVLMKHVLLLHGEKLEHLKSQFGHDIMKMWNDNRMAPFRKAAEEEAKVAWQNAKHSQSFADDFEFEDPVEALHKHLRLIAKLHSPESDFALRYIASAGQQVPVPLLLLDTFKPLKNRLALAYSRKDKDF